MSKLTHLHVEDFMRIELVDVQLEDHVTEISGKNRAGKSSTLNAIACLLQGLDAAPAVPIRKGCEQAASDIKQLRAQHDQGQARCEELLKEIQRIRDGAQRALLEADALQEKLDAAPPLPEAIDVSAVRAKLDASRRTNSAVTLRRKRAEHIAAAEKYEQQSEQLTARIAARNNHKAEAIANANIPVPGIGFGDRCVLLNDLPFQQASTAEQLATVFALIVALNPKVRLAWIRDASLLDDDMRKTVTDLAAKYDIQVLLETVKPGSANAIVLENGNVKETASEHAAAQGSLV